MAAEIILDGFDELLAKVEEMGKAASKIENDALRAAAEPVQNTASSLLKDHRSKIHEMHLADNIAISKVKSQNGIRYVEVGPIKGDNSKFFYGKFLEWGTSKMPARPFMGPAYEQNKRNIVVIIAKRLKEALGL